MIFQKITASRNLQLKFPFRGLLTCLALGTTLSANSNSLLEAATSQKSTGEKVLIFDLGLVLFGPSKRRILSHLGFWDAVTYNIFDQGQDYLRGLVNKVLESIRSTQEESGPAIPDDKGRALPRITVEYQAGLITSEQALQEIALALEEQDEQGLFASKRERRLVERVLEMIFTPRIFAHCMRPIKAGVALVDRCAEVCNSSGEQKHRLMVLSNWDAESAAELAKLPHGQRVFNYFEPENILVSGNFRNTEHLKPYATPFHNILRMTGKAPGDHYFFDDQPTNIATALALGFNAYLVTPENYEAIAEKLEEAGIFASEDNTAAISASVVYNPTESRTESKRLKRA